MKLRRVNVLYILILFNLLLFAIPDLLSMFLSASLRLNSTELYIQLLGLLGGLQGVAVYAGEWWRLVTANFLHLDLIHIAVNLFGLYRLGQIIRAHYGDRKLFIFYIISGIGGSILSLFFLNPYTLSVGASGAVFGLMGVLLAGSVRSRRFGTELPYAFADLLPLLVYSLLPGFIPGTNVNNFAHLGGLITGFILAWFIPHNMVGWKNKQIDLAVGVLFYIAVGLTVISYLFVIAQVVQFFL
jgi:rhomboid protease GluP